MATEVSMSPNPQPNLTFVIVFMCGSSLLISARCRKLNSGLRLRWFLLVCGLLCRRNLSYCRWELGIAVVRRLSMCHMGVRCCNVDDRMMRLVVITIQTRMLCFKGNKNAVNFAGTKDMRLEKRRGQESDAVRLINISNRHFRLGRCTVWRCSKLLGHVQDFSDAPFYSRRRAVKTTLCTGLGCHGCVVANYVWQVLAMGRRATRGYTRG
jgi:hypothetical protein